MKNTVCLFLLAFIYSSTSNGMDAIAEVPKDVRMHSTSEDSFNGLPAELTIPITNALCVNQKLQATAADYQNLRATSKFFNHTLDANIDNTINNISQYYRIPPFLTATYLETKASQSWIQEQEKKPYGVYNILKPLINYSRHRAAYKAAARLAIIDPEQKCKKVAEFLKLKSLHHAHVVIPRLVKPIDSAEVDNTLAILLDSPVDNYQLVKKHILGQYKLPCPPSQDGLIGIDHNRFFKVGLTRNELFFQEMNDVPSVQPARHSIGLQHDQRLKDVLLKDQSCFALLVGQNRLSILNLENFNINQSFGQNGVLNHTLEQTIDTNNLCLAHTDNSIIIGNTDTYQKICEFDLQGNRIAEPVQNQITHRSCSPCTIS